MSAAPVGGPHPLATAGYWTILHANHGDRNYELDPNGDPVVFYTGTVLVCDCGSAYAVPRISPDELSERCRAEEVTS